MWEGEMACVCVEGRGGGFRQPQRWLVSHRMVHLMIFFSSFLVFFWKGVLKNIKGRSFMMRFLKRPTEKLQMIKERSD